MAKKKPFTVNNNLRIITVIKMATKNDNNGNPRRMWVVLNTTPSEIAPLTLSGDVIAYIDEGYSGNAGVKALIEKAIKPFHDTLVIWGPTFETTIAEYNTMKRSPKVRYPERAAVTKLEKEGV